MRRRPLHHRPPQRLLRRNNNDHTIVFHHHALMSRTSDTDTTNMRHSIDAGCCNRHFVCMVRRLCESPCFRLVSSTLSCSCGTRLIKSSIGGFPRGIKNDVILSFFARVQTKTSHTRRQSKKNKNNNAHTHVGRIAAPVTFKHLDQNEHATFLVTASNTQIAKTRTVATTTRRTFL